MGVCVLILAAGWGKRMLSPRSKVLHTIAGKPMISFLLDSVQELDLEDTFVITGHQSSLVKQEVGDRGCCLFQKDLLGTASAVRVFKDHYLDQKKSYTHVLILCGDVPFLSSSTMQSLIGATTKTEDVKGSVLVSDMDNPFGYGRIIESSDGHVESIIEEKNATEEQKKIETVNSGAYCFEVKALFEVLDDILLDEESREYQLTRVAELFDKRGWKMRAVLTENSWEVKGVNSPKDIADLGDIFQRQQKKV